MVRRALRYLLLAASVVLALSASVLAYFAYTRFFRYQRAVDKIYERIPAEERQMSAPARRVMERTEPDSTRTNIVSRYLLSEIAPARVRIAEWNVRGMLWMWLLPRRFDPEQRLNLFAHFLAFEGGSGIAYGARKYLGKSASQLTEDEALKLMAISASPLAYSPAKHPDRFRQRLKITTDRYRVAVER
jgi:hypothetical protein